MLCAIPFTQKRDFRAVAQRACEVRGFASGRRAGLAVTAIGPPCKTLSFRNLNPKAVTGTRDDVRNHALLVESNVNGGAACGLRQEMSARQCFSQFGDNSLVILFGALISTVRVAGRKFALCLTRIPDAGFCVARSRILPSHMLGRRTPILSNAISSPQLCARRRREMGKVSRVKRPKGTPCQCTSPSPGGA